MLADRVHAKREGMQHNMGLSFIIPVCDECGVLLIDQERHDNWHDALIREYQRGWDHGHEGKPPMPPVNGAE